MEQQFNNHYELAALLREKISGSLPEGCFIGRVDILLKFLQKIGMDNPKEIHMYLDSFDKIKESAGSKTIVDCFADLILNHNPDYYNQYVEAKYESSFNNPYISIQKQMLLSKENEQLNSFVERWILFEKAIKALEQKDTIQSRSISDIIRRHLTADEIILDAVKNLEKTRNQIVYSSDIPDNLQLRNAADSITLILNKLAELASDENKAVIYKALDKVTKEF